MKRIARNWTVLLTASTLILIMGCFLAKIWATETATSEIDGQGTINPVAGSYDLKVQGKSTWKPEREEDIEATGRKVLQGSVGQVTLYTGVKTIKRDQSAAVANAPSVTAEGEILVSVWGNYVGGTGGQGTGGGWKAGYNRGDRRLVAIINETLATTDDYIAKNSPETSGSITVAIAGSDNGESYSIDLSDYTGPGVAGFFPDGASTFSDMLGKIDGKWIDEFTTDLYGKTAGETDIVAECVSKNLDVIIPVTVVDVTLAAAGAEKIASVIPDSLIDHFVTPKGAAADVVTLTATITPNTEAVRAALNWTGATENAANPLVATVSKAAANKLPVEVTVGGATIKKANTWVVWATGAVANTFNIPVENNALRLLANGKAALTQNCVLQDKTYIKGGYGIAFAIAPKTIITDAERPNLSGNNINAPPNVPAGDANVYQKGVNLAGGATKKWDISRQLRQKCVNPNNLNLNTVFPAGEVALFFTNYLNFPSDSLCGNDDKGAGDEINDPYNNPYKEKLFALDAPGNYLPHSLGAKNDTYELRLHFREFSRLELNGTWYRISDNFLWKAHHKFKKIDTKEANFNHDFNGDGDKIDTVPVWRNNGSSIGLDNAGF